MKIEISEQARADAIASIQRYFEENLPEQEYAVLLRAFQVLDLAPAG